MDRLSVDVIVFCHRDIFVLESCTARYEVVLSPNTETRNEIP